MGTLADDEQDRLLSACVRQLDSLVGDPGRVALTKALVPWDSAYALSGIRANGRSVWRFMPRLEEGRTVESTLVSENPATFRVRDWRVSIPGGQVVRQVPELSSLGYWVLGRGA